MKKALSVLCTALMLCGLAAPVFADSDAATVYVSISDDKGALVLAYESIDVTDADADGALTIADALYCAHDAKFEGGAEVGFACEDTQYGLSLTKLWGVENGGSYGYYVNDNAAMSLGDPIISGDHVKAFVYTDLTAWSDSYCFFDAAAVSAKVGTTLTLTLSCAGYDESWNPVTLSVEGATITVNGNATEAVTDANGQAALALTEVGSFTVSATSDAKVLVPPVCFVTVEAAEAVEAPTEPEVTPEPEATVEPEVTPEPEATVEPESSDTIETIASPNTADVRVELFALCAALSLAATSVTVGSKKFTK